MAKNKQLEQLLRREAMAKPFRTKETEKSQKRNFKSVNDVQHTIDQLEIRNKEDFYILITAFQYMQKYLEVKGVIPSNPITEISIIDDACSFIGEYWQTLNTEKKEAIAAKPLTN